jgi:hypothetical protein
MNERNERRGPERYQWPGCRVRSVWLERWARCHQHGSQRNAHIHLAAVGFGVSNLHLARAFGISRERVRQIIFTAERRMARRYVGRPRRARRWVIGEPDRTLERGRLLYWWTEEPEEGAWRETTPP